MTTDRRRPWDARIAGLLAWLCLAPALLGCTALSGPASIEPPPSLAGPAFPGLLPSSENRAPRRFIFQIHGIDTSDPNWGESLLGRIPKYGYIRERTPGPIDTYWHPATLSEAKVVAGPGLVCTDHPGCVFNNFGIYKKDVFRNASTGDVVTVFTYFWRADLWTITGAYLRDDVLANNVTNWRPNTRKSLINASLKAGLVDNGLSDAAGYLSGLGALEREGLESALCAMLEDAIATPQASAVAPGTGCLGRLAPLNTLNGRDVEFNFLSHSLGSRMLYDVLSAREPVTGASRTREATSARMFISDQTRTFFMAANQLPLLAESSLTISPAPEAALGSNPEPGAEEAAALEARPRSFADLRGAAPRTPGERSRARTPALTIVAFQDPDDLLGFKASDAIVGATDPTASVKFVDVVHRNTPQILYVLASPLAAHDSEMKEPHSREMILCGANADPLGHLKADRCLGRTR
jgi:hypothetical protein